MTSKEITNGAKLRQASSNIVPDEERNAIIQEAKEQTLTEIVKRSKTISQLDEIQEYGPDDKLEISNSRSIKFSSVVSQIIKEIHTKIGSIFTYCGSVTKYSELPADAEVGNVYNVEEAYEHNPKNANYVWNGEDWDVLSGEIDLDGYLTITSAEENYVKKVIGKELISTEKIEQIDTLSSEILKCVQFTDLGNGRKCIVLNNNDLLVGTSLDGSTYNLIMLSKFDIIDVGTVSKKLNLNVPKGERVTVQEAGQTGEQANKIAYLSDIPNFVNKFIDGNKLFALTTNSTSEEVKAALTYAGFNTTVTIQDLDECIKYGKYLRDILYQPITVSYTGTAYLLSEVSMITPKSDVFVSNVVISIDSDGVHRCVKSGERTKLVKEQVVLDITNKLTELTNRVSLLEKLTSNKIVNSLTGQTYSTVADAIAGGATSISLFQNITEDITIESGKTLNIYGNGNTITGYVKCAVGKSGGETNLIIENAKLVSNSKLHGINSQDQECLTPSKLNLALKNVTFENYTEKGLYITNPGIVTLEKVTFINCAEGSDYVVDFNICAVTGSEIDIDGIAFIGKETKNSLIKVTQRGGEDDYAHDIKTGVHVWNSETSQYDEQEGAPAKIEHFNVKNVLKTITGESMIADITIGSSPNTDGPAVGPRTSNGNFKYEVLNDGKSKVWLRYISESEFIMK